MLARSCEHAQQLYKVSNLLLSGCNPSIVGTLCLICSLVIIPGTNGSCKWLSAGSSCRCNFSFQLAFCRIPSPAMAPTWATPPVSTTSSAEAAPPISPGVSASQYHSMQTAMRMERQTLLHQGHCNTLYGCTDSYAVQQIAKQHNLVATF